VDVKSETTVRELVQLAEKAPDIPSAEFDREYIDEICRMLGDYSVEQIGHVAIACLGAIGERNERMAHAFVHTVWKMYHEDFGSNN
jgi:hypothetical protein